MNITKEQLIKINDLQYTLGASLDFMQDICIKDTDYIKIGFNLGLIHKRIQDCQYDLIHLYKEINNENRQD